MPRQIIPASLLLTAALLWTTCLHSPAVTADAPPRKSADLAGSSKPEDRDDAPDFKPDDNPDADKRDTDKKNADQDAAGKEDKKDRDRAFAAKDNDFFPEYAEKKLTLPDGLAYTATTGMTPIFDNEGEEKARIFSTSYIKAGGDRERPVTFLFNGGPGSASVYLHAASFAPKAFPFTGTGVEVPRPPFKLVDNPDCLLDVTDLVFVDPVGTGYSYALPPEDGEEAEKTEDKGKSGGKAKAEYAPFWGVDQDIDSITEFVRVWLDRNERWGARLFIGGESYGGLRAAGLAGSLAKIGAAPSGIILISPATSYVGLEYSLENYTPVIVTLPVYAAVAHYHHRLEAALQLLSEEELTGQVEEWCLSRLLPALWQGNRLPPVLLDQLAGELSRFIGIPVDDVKIRRFRVGSDDISRLLLRDRGLTLSLYDARLTAPASAEDRHSYAEDPLDLVAGENIKTGFRRFLSETLGLKTLRKYHFSSDSAFEKWDFTQGGRGLYGYPSTVDSLAKAMRRLPYLRVYLAMGRYDMITPAESALQSMKDLDIPAGRQENITTKIYEGGHMMYTNPLAKKALADDLRKWIRESF